MSELQVHREWGNGEWSPSKKQRTTGMIFSNGKKVEVCFEKENFRDVWFPATVIEDLGNDSFLVKYKIPRTGEEDEEKEPGRIYEETTVDSLHIRPSPPNLNYKNFVLFEEVDAFYDFGWWNGVITKRVPASKYLIFFKHTNKEMELDQSELRPHMEWRDGKWFSSSRRKICMPEDEDRGIMPSPNFFSTWNKGNTQIGGGTISNQSKKRRGRPPKLSPAKNLATDVGDDKLMVVKDEIGTPANGHNEGKLPGSCSATMPTNNFGDTMETPVTEIEAEAEAEAEGDKKYRLTKQRQEKSNTSNMPDDLPLSAWVVRDDSQTTSIGDSNVSPSKKNKAEESSEGWAKGQIPAAPAYEEAGEEESAAGVAALHSETERLPFVKNPALWGAIESMEVFKRMPQKPHFRDLVSCNEIYREGLAVACMVNFSSVVENSYRLQLDDPRSKFESHLKTLVEMEGHGFDVKLVRDRLNELLMLKNREEELQRRYKQVESEFTKENSKISEIVEKNALNMKQLKELEETNALLVANKEKKDSDIASMESKLQGINDAISNVRHEFVQGLAHVFL